MNTNFEVREARLSDLDTIVAIEYASFRYDRMSRRALRYALKSETQIIFVALSENVVIGYACLQWRQAGSATRLYSIAVLDSYRKQGVASELFNYIFNFSRDLGHARITLEVRDDAPRVISFYTSLGFYPIGLKRNYYEDGCHAIKMEYRFQPSKKSEWRRTNRNKLVIVVPRSQDISAVSEVTNIFSHAQLMTVRQFLAAQDLLGNTIRIINLCPADEYLSSGYYVSLIGEARGNKTLASIHSLSGLVRRKLYTEHLEELNRLLPSADIIEGFIGNQNIRKISLEFYFGQTACDWARRLSKRCYNLFAVPILEVQIIYKQGRWQVDYLWPLSISSVDDKDRPRFIQSLQVALTSRLPNPSIAKSSSFELAILIDKDEMLPPSNPRALAAFTKAAAAENLHASFITKDDFSRLSAFDALFIRTTTQIDHYSYRFALAAQRLGMPVIDDPQSILRCSNKVFLTEALMRASIVTPRSWLVMRSNLTELSDQLTYPIVLKIPDGSFSRGMHKVENKDSFIARSNEMLGQSFVILAQEFLPTVFDWRIGVLNGTPLYACKYFMSRGHWQIYHHKANNKYDTGGFAAIELMDVPELVLQTAIRASLVIGHGLYGVDLKEIDGQVLVIEVNDNPNIDYGIEDKLKGAALYSDIISVFKKRIWSRMGISNTDIIP